jgi:hypothetical protein
MKALLLALALLPTLANAADFTCEGREGVRGTVTLHILESGKAVVKGSYNWDAQSGEDTSLHTLNCAGNMNNVGRSGNKTHDYFDLKGCPEYLRTGKEFAKGSGGWMSLVTSGPNDHDSSGYSYAGFYCK